VPIFRIRIFHNCSGIFFVYTISEDPSP
jgi:hypothetical protein